MCNLRCDVILFYNSTNAELDTVGQVVCYYSCHVKTCIGHWHSSEPLRHRCCQRFGDLALQWSNLECQKISSVFCRVKIKVVLQGVMASHSEREKFFHPTPPNPPRINISAHCQPHGKITKIHWKQEMAISVNAMHTTLMAIKKLSELEVGK